jgi:hypothetical protein
MTKGIHEDIDKIRSDFGGISATIRSDFDEMKKDLRHMRNML